MPSKKKNIIETLRKSFGMQRETLIRVLGLEKKIEELQAAKQEVEEVVEDRVDVVGDGKIDGIVDVIGDAPQEAVEDKVEEAVETKVDDNVEARLQALEKGIEEIEDKVEEEIPEGLDDLIDEVRGEREVGEDEVGSDVASKVGVVDGEKKPPFKVNKRKISAEDLKKGTALDSDFGSRVHGIDEEGEYLSGEERKMRFRKSKISADDIRGTKPVDQPPEPPSKDEGDNKETEGLKGIRDVLDDILKVLRLDFKDDRKEARDRQKEDNKKKRTQKEDKLEGGVKKSIGLIGKSLKAIVSPFSTIWDAVFKFLKFTLLNVLFVKTLDWFGDPKNQKKAERIGKFFKDWWPALATAAALFLTPLGGLVKGVVGLLTAIIPKLVMAIAANPYAALALVGTGLAVWGVSKLANANKKEEERPFFLRIFSSEPMQLVQLQDNIE